MMMDEIKGSLQTTMSTRRNRKHSRHDGNEIRGSPSIRKQFIMSVSAEFYEIYFSVFDVNHQTVQQHLELVAYKEAGILLLIPFTSARLKLHTLDNDAFMWLHQRYPHRRHSEKLFSRRFSVSTSLLAAKPFG